MIIVPVVRQQWWRRFLPKIGYCKSADPDGGECLLRRGHKHAHQNGRAFWTDWM